MLSSEICPKWFPPPIVSIKFNFDGCSLGNPRQLVIGEKFLKIQAGEDMAIEEKNSCSSRTSKL